MSGGQVRWSTTHGDLVTVYRTHIWVEISEEDNEWRRESEWRFRVQAGNNEIGDISSEGYKRRIDAVTAAERHHPRTEP